MKTSTQILTDIEEEKEPNDPAFREVEGRRSIKYWIENSTFSAAIFACNPDVARNRAIEVFNLDINDPVTVYRMQEPSNILTRLN